LPHQLQANLVGSVLEFLNGRCAARDQALARIRRLEGAIAIHERRQSRRSTDWGFPGDLAHITDRLRDITPSHSDRRCEWKHPKTCGQYAAYCLPDGQLICPDHAPETGFDPSECLDVETGMPADQD
jgi:hypothetical protein